MGTPSLNVGGEGWEGGEGEEEIIISAFIILAFDLL